MDGHWLPGAFLGLMGGLPLGTSQWCIWVWHRTTAVSSSVSHIFFIYWQPVKDPPTRQDSGTWLKWVVLIKLFSVHDIHVEFISRLKAAWRQPTSPYSSVEGCTSSRVPGAGQNTRGCSFRGVPHAAPSAGIPSQHQRTLAGNTAPWTSAFPTPQDQETMGKNTHQWLWAGEKERRELFLVQPLKLWRQWLDCKWCLRISAFLFFRSCTISVY